MGLTDLKAGIPTIPMIVLHYYHEWLCRFNACTRVNSYRDFELLGQVEEVPPLTRFNIAAINDGTLSSQQGLPGQINTLLPGAPAPSLDCVLQRIYTILIPYPHSAL